MAHARVQKRYLGLRKGIIHPYIGAKWHSSRSVRVGVYILGMIGGLYLKIQKFCPVVGGGLGGRFDPRGVLRP